MNEKSEFLEAAEELIKECISYALRINNETDKSVNVSIIGKTQELWIYIDDYRNSDSIPVVFKEVISNFNRQLVDRLNKMLTFLKDFLKNRNINYSLLKPIQRVIPAEPAKPETVKIAAYEI